MLHWAIFRATCVATKLRDKLQEKLPSVTAPLRRVFLYTITYCIFHRNEQKKKIGEHMHIFFPNHHHLQK